VGDVPKKDLVGPDDEEALPLEQLAVLVEQEGGSVEADCGLSRSRPALHDHQVFERSPDHHVLLGLDGGHDVAHLPGARPLELGEEGIGKATSAGRVGIGEILVEDVDEHASLHAEPPAAGEAQRVGVGRPVEGARHARPPVDHDGLTGRALHVPAPDVEAVALVGVEASEAEGGRRLGQGCEPPLEVPLDDGRVRGLLESVGTLSERERARRALTHRRKARVGVVEVPLFRGEVWVRVHGGRRR
jgi:hypothetical protein